MLSTQIKSCLFLLETDSFWQPYGCPAHPNLSANSRKLNYFLITVKLKCTPDQYKRLMQERSAANRGER